MKKFILFFISFFLTIHLFAQAGYYESESDFRSGKLIEMDSFVDMKSSKLFFMNKGEEVKVKKKEYFAFRDNDGFDYRLYEKRTGILSTDKKLAKLHIYNNICIWGFGMDSSLAEEDDGYVINTPAIFASKNKTSELILVSASNLEDIVKLIKQDSKLYNIVKRIQKTTFYSHRYLLLYILDTFNERKSKKDKYRK